jgi:hypothetical protein
MNVRRVIATAALALALGAPEAAAQPGGGALGAGISFNAGQPVQPIFEGWTKNADGSFELHFGYFNRNYVETPSVPIGPGNSFEPAPLDRGQPAFFYPRYNRRAFSVTVPKDFGKKEITWKLTTNGKTEQAVGWLQVEWEIEPAQPGVGGGASASAPRTPSKNEAPKITVANPGPVAVGSRLTLTANVTDDGLPAAASAMGRGRGAGGGRGAGRGRGAGDAAGTPAAGTTAAGTAGAGGGAAAAGRAGAAAAATAGTGAGRPGGPPTFRRESNATTPTNVPEIDSVPRTPRLPGLSVTWLVWRGPAGVTFDPAAVAVKDGTAVVGATFKTPGEYVLRARASDGSATTQQDIKVVVADTAR